MIIGLYAGGMTAREIRHHLESTIGVDLSRGTISKVTDAVRRCRHGVAAPASGGLLPGDPPRRDPRQGPRRPPGAGDARTRIAVGAGHGRRQARAGDLDPGRGGGLLLGPRVRRSGQQGRAGRADRVLRRADRPARGRPGRSWPDSMVPTCVVHPGPRHPCGSSPTGTARGSPPPRARACTAPDEEAARRALDAFRQSDPGRKYPQTAATWERAWERFIPFLAFPPALRRVTSAPPTRSSR